jgi:hypothetical protein
LLDAEGEKRRLLKQFKDHRVWKSTEGAPPLDDKGRPNPECRFPRALLAEFGFLENAA